MFQQGEIDSIGDGVALTQDPGDFARLPVDDARGKTLPVSYRDQKLYFIAKSQAATGTPAKSEGINTPFQEMPTCTPSYSEPSWARMTSWVSWPMIRHPFR